jgi:hypothetical protein
VAGGALQPAGRVVEAVDAGRLVNMGMRRAVFLMATSI